MIRYPSDFNLLLGLTILFLAITLILIILYKKSIPFLGEIYFGMGISFLSGGIITYDVIDDTTLLISILISGLIWLIIGAYIKINFKHS
jgi:hypothetical protein